MTATRYKLTDYLENRVLVKNTGTCKACGKNVYWSREKVNSHKRSKNCDKVTEDELNFFLQTLPSSRKRKIEEECDYKDDKAASFTDNKSKELKKEDENDCENKESISIPLMITASLSSEVTEQLEEALPMSKPAKSHEKEDKFIEVIYPNFKGISKIKLIEEIIELKRKNEILEDKVKTFAKAINDLL